MLGSLGAISLGLIAGRPGGYWVISCSTGSLSASRTATTRVPCRTLPAPTAISRSALAARALSRAATTSSIGESLPISS